MKANKSFLNAKGERINYGDELKEKDYPKNIWESYQKTGLIGPDEKKPAKPKSTKKKAKK